MSVYVDASAAAKLLIEEAESPALGEHLDRVAADGAAIVASTLLETELRRLAVREELAQSAVSDLLDRIDLAEPNKSLFYEAGILPGRRLRSLDALHLATAIRLEADEIVAYDQRLAEAARSVGLQVTMPA